MYKLYDPKTSRYSAPLDVDNLAIIKNCLDLIKTNYPELCPIWCIDMETGEILYQSDENESKENSFCARVNAIAEELEQLSIDLAKAKANLKDQEDINDVQEISDKLFSWQSTLRYSVHSILECIFED